MTNSFYLRHQLTPDEDDGSSPALLADEALNITDEFALRFSVEPLYRTMVYV